MDMPWFLRFLRFLYHRLAPAEGGLSLVALSAAVAALAGAVTQARWTPNAPRMYGAGLLAAWLGAWLAKKATTAWRIWAAVGLTSGVGLVFCVLTAARAWPPATVLLPNLRWGLAWLAGRETRLVGIPLDLWLGEHLGDWAEMFQKWWLEVSAGHKAPSPEPFAFFLLLAVWAAAAWAGWMTYRRRHALVALTPAGVLLAANVFYSFMGAQWLLLYMAGLALLALNLRQYTLQRDWDQRRIDYSSEIRLEAYLYGAILTLAIVAFMFLMPNIDVHAISRTLWQIVSRPANVAETKVETIFPALDRPRPLPDARVTGLAGGLPRSHLLGGGPELAKRLVMHVRVSGDDASITPTNYHWRSLTYTDYNGRGWENPAPLAIERFQPGEVWRQTPLRQRRPLRQVVAFIQPNPGWLFAAGEPLSVDQPYAAHLRGPDDAIGLELHARDYLAISYLPDISADQLRAAPASAPGDMTPYLTLPATVPARVQQLARQITAETTTSFDQALALETYLRVLPYSLDVPAPPANIDVADFFLFDLQRGYCDYFATAFVVMAHSIGLPARLAIGYAAGSYDAASGQFTVTEADAHSWPEVYFPGVGWIPFEPTPSQPTFTYQAAAPATEISQEVVANELAGLQRRAWLAEVRRWGLPLLSLLALASLSLPLRREWRLRRQAANPWQLAYLRLETWGQRWGVLPAPWFTAGEYAARWQDWLTRQPDSDLLAQQIGDLCRGLEHRAYAPPTSQPSPSAAGEQWRALRGQLWRLRWRRLFSVRLSPRAKKRRDF